MQWDNKWIKFHQTQLIYTDTMLIPALRYITILETQTNAQFYNL